MLKKIPNELPSNRKTKKYERNKSRPSIPGQQRNASTPPTLIYTWASVCNMLYASYSVSLCPCLPGLSAPPRPVAPPRSASHPLERPLNSNGAPPSTALFPSPIPPMACVVAIAVAPTSRDEASDSADATNAHSPILHRGRRLVVDAIVAMPSLTRSLVLVKHGQLSSECLSKIA